MTYYPLKIDTSDGKLKAEINGTKYPAKMDTSDNKLKVDLGTRKVPAKMYNNALSIPDDCDASTCNYCVNYGVPVGKVIYAKAVYLEPLNNYYQETRNVDSHTFALNYQGYESNTCTWSTVEEINGVSYTAILTLTMSSGNFVWNYLLRLTSSASAIVFEGGYAEGQYMPMAPIEDSGQSTAYKVAYQGALYLWDTCCTPCPPVFSLAPDLTKRITVTFGSLTDCDTSDPDTIFSNQSFVLQHTSSNSGSDEEAHVWTYVAIDQGSSIYNSSWNSISLYYKFDKIEGKWEAGIIVNHYSLGNTAFIGRVDSISDPLDITSITSSCSEGSLSGSASISALPIDNCCSSPITCTNFPYYLDIRFDNIENCSDLECCTECQDLFATDINYENAGTFTLTRTSCDSGTAHYEYIGPIYTCLTYPNTHYVRLEIGVIYNSNTGTITVKAAYNLDRSSLFTQGGHYGGWRLMMYKQNMRTVSLYTSGGNDARDYSTYTPLYREDGDKGYFTTSEA